MALNQVTDNMGGVVFGDVRAIIMGDRVKCTGTIADMHRLCSYLRAQGVKTGELVVNMGVVVLASTAPSSWVTE